MWFRSDFADDLRQESKPKPEPLSHLHFEWFALMLGWSDDVLEKHWRTYQDFVLVTHSK